MLRGIWVKIMFGIATMAFAVPATILAMFLPGTSNLIIRSGRLWSRSLLWASGARVTYHGLERATTANPCIYIANHQSVVDIWVMFSFIPETTRFVAKQELFRIPMFGWALAASGCIPINRGSRTEAIQSLKIAAEKIREGRSVVLYPEGRRSCDGTLQAFKKGAFHLALEAGVPVVPVAIVGSFDVVPPGALRVKPGPVEVYIEPHVDPTPYRPGDHEGLLRTVREAIARRFDAWEARHTTA
jgi:1-acyl-sn-glycerol-3-phosphate acyltransferase